MAESLSHQEPVLLGPDPQSNPSSPIKPLQLRTKYVWKEGKGLLQIVPLGQKEKLRGGGAPTMAAPPRMEHQGFANLQGAHESKNTDDSKQREKAKND